jgi:DNA invertase Pin-like site-specific DNA recombinase
MLLSSYVSTGNSGQRSAQGGLQQLPGRGIEKIDTVQQGVISVGSGNRLVGRLLAIVDAEEVERTRARVLAAHQQLAVEGRPQGGRCYGFDYERDAEKRSVRVINPAEAQVVREIADKLVSGHSATSIAGDLNARGVPSPRGKGRWHLSSLKYVISKPAVAGLRSHHGKLTEVVGVTSFSKLAGAKQFGPWARTW